MSARSLSPIEILLIEDNPGDVMLTKEAFSHMKVRNTIHTVTDGEQALAYLHRRPPYEAAQRPHLILLDLNLPGLDGREVLQEIKGDDALKSIPVVVMTSSEAETDIERSYELHANSYIVKPVGLQGFMDVVASIDEFWFSIVILPPG